MDIHTTTSVETTEKMYDNGIVCSAKETTKVIVEMEAWEAKDINMILARLRRQKTIGKSEFSMREKATARRLADGLMLVETDLAIRDVWRGGVTHTDTHVDIVEAKKEWDKMKTLTYSEWMQERKRDFMMNGQPRDVPAEAEAWRWRLIQAFGLEDRRVFGNNRHLGYITSVEQDEDGHISVDGTKVEDAIGHLQRKRLEQAGEKLKKQLIDFADTSNPNVASVLQGAVNTFLRNYSDLPHEELEKLITDIWKEVTDGADATPEEGDREAEQWEDPMGWCWLREDNDRISVLHAEGCVRGSVCGYNSKEEGQSGLGKGSRNAWDFNGSGLLSVREARRRLMEQHLQVRRR